MFIYILKLGALLLLGFYCLSLPFVHGFIDVYCRELAQVLAGVVNIFDSGVEAHDSIIFRHSYAYAVDVDSSCSGLDFVLILTAAILAYPLPWHKRLLMLIPAIGFVLVLNGVRIVSLLYVRLWWDMPEFHFTHEQVWPLLLALSVNFYFLFWFVRTPAAGHRV